jgi:hypothetical protein
MADRFATALDCADISFIADGTLDEFPLPSRLGATRTGGIDLNKPRIRAALSAALALTAAPRGFTVAEFTTRVQAMTGQAGKLPPVALARPLGIHIGTAGAWAERAGGSPGAYAAQVSRR